MQEFSIYIIIPIFTTLLSHLGARHQARKDLQKLRESQKYEINKIKEEAKYEIEKINHFRDRSKGILEYVTTVKKSFNATKEIDSFLVEVQKKYPRYIKNQLETIQKVAKDYTSFSQQALEICIKENLCSANDLKTVAKHLELIDNNHIPDENNFFISKLESKTHFEKATLRELDSYIKILGGV